MAFAPHHNQNVQNQLRLAEDKSAPTALPLVLGQFRHKDTDVLFEFAERRHPDDSFAPDMPHVIYVGPDSESRLAKVLKTVAYVVVDEEANGEPVIEKWQIKQFRAYDTEWVRAEA